MAKIRRKGSIFLLAAVLCMSSLAPLGGILPIAAQDNALGFTEDFEDGAGLGGFAGSLGDSVKIVQEASGNHAMFISPAADGIPAFAQQSVGIGDNVPLDISLDFMQFQKKTNGTEVLRLMKDGANLLLIETLDGNLVMQKALSENVYTLVEDYSANRWYHISATIDFTTGFINVCVDGKIMVEEAALLTQKKSADLLYVGTKYAPGFYVDNVRVVPKQNVTALEMDGETALFVGGEETRATYTIRAYDQNNVPVYGAAAFFLSPRDEGVTMEVDGDTAVLVATEAAAGKTFTLTVHAGELTESKQITVTGYERELRSMTIKGAGKLSSKTRYLSVYPYSVAFYDQFGREMLDEHAVFRLEGQIPDTLQLNSVTGEITVTGELPKDKRVVLVAQSVSNPAVSVSKTLTLLDAETYASDAARFDVLLNYVDTVRDLGRDTFRNTPLLATAFDRTNGTPAVWRSGSTYHTVPSNLAFQGMWFRTLEGLHALTGDQQYEDEILETYRLYMDNYLDDPTGVPYWGGHAAVDMQNGTPYLIYGSRIHEMKDTGAYFDPFFWVDQERAAEIVKNIVCLHVTDWSSMVFSRHGYYGTKVDRTAWNTWPGWKNTVQSEVYGPDSPVKSTSISFRASAADFLDCLGALYRLTGDEAAKAWGRNLLEGYYRVEHPETFIGGYQTNTAKGSETGTLPENWWLPGIFKEEYTYGTYGDRFYNQFADDLVDQGFLKEEDKWMALECMSNWDADMYSIMPIHELRFAEAIGLDSEDGAYILERIVKKLGKFIDIAYDAKRNQCQYFLLADGTRLDKFVKKKNGYYGSDVIGTSSGPLTPGTVQVYAYAQAYLRSHDRPDLQPYRDSIYYFLRNYFLAVGVGDLGEAYPGDNASINTRCESADAYLCLALLSMYQDTGEIQFLDGARRLADNFIASYMSNGLFSIYPNAAYQPLGTAKADRFMYALLLLEAVITNQEDLIPQNFVPYESYFHDRSYDQPERGMVVDSAFDSKDTHVWFGFSYDGVNATEIILPEQEITLAPGETKYLEISVLPVDASKAVEYSMTNPACLTVNYDNNSITGRNRGTTDLVLTNAAKTARTVVKVTVE